MQGNKAGKNRKNGRHKILAQNNCTKRRKDLEELIEEAKEGVKEKRYEKWKVLELVFMRYYEITEGSC